MGEPKRPSRCGHRPSSASPSRCARVVNLAGRPNVVPLARDHRLVRSLSSTRLVTRSQPGIGAPSAVPRLPQAKAILAMATSKVSRMLSSSGKCTPLA